MSGKERFTFFLTVGLCVLISGLIVVHSYDYLSNYFSPLIAWSFAGVIEISFVGMSIIGSLVGRWSRRDRILKAILFFLSVIPATLQTSQEVRQLVFKEITATPPAKPYEPVLQRENLTSDLKMIDDEIRALRKSKNSYDPEAEGGTWYAYQDQKRIDNLMKRRTGISSNLNQVNSEYEVQLKKYNSERENFQAQDSFDDYEVWFSLAFLIWTVSLIWALQLLNARFSSNAALLLSGSAENPDLKFYDDEYPEIEKYTDYEPISEEQFSPKTLPELTEDFQFLLPKQEAQNLLNQLDIQSLEDLKAFFEKENWENKLSENFDEETLQKYTEYLETLKTRL